MRAEQNIPAGEFCAPDPKPLARQPLDQFPGNGASRLLFTDDEAAPRIVAVGLPDKTKCRERRQGRKQKTDEYSSAFNRLAALGNTACARN